MQLSTKAPRLLLLSTIGVIGAASVASLLPIELIKTADCTLGYMCGLYRQSLIISAVYGIPANPLHRMSFALMLLVYYVALIVFTQQLLRGISLKSK